jgi:hypothetical protein
MIMENIPTAEEFYQHAIDDKNIGDDITDLLNAYAKLHVEAALKAAAEMGKETWDWTAEECNSIIEDVYPLENIK